MKRPKILSASFVRSINRPGRYGDGHGGFGLSLLVKPMINGRLSKTWSQRLRIVGRPVNVGLGSYPVVSLAEARTKALENRRAVDQGRDPRSKPGDIPSFADAAERVIALHEPTWKDGARSAEIWRASLRDYVYPKLGKLPVDKITTAHVLSALIPIWNEKRETAKRVRQRIGAVMKWAVAQNFREDNPAGDAIGAALPKTGQQRQHQRALPYGEVEGALRTVRESGAWPATKHAFEFLVLTASRSGEVRGCLWAEIDGGTWTVPGERMKSNQPHCVSLSSRALEILRQARELSDGSGLVFPSPTGRMLSDMTISKLVKELGIPAVPHGFRSSFRTWCAEQTNFPREICEEALGHVNPNKVEAAYQRSDLFERRRELMQRWADYLTPTTSCQGRDEEGV